MALSKINCSSNPLLDALNTAQEEADALIDGLATAGQASLDALNSKLEELEDNLKAAIPDLPELPSFQNDLVKAMADLALKGPAALTEFVDRWKDAIPDLDDIINKLSLGDFDICADAPNVELDENGKAIKKATTPTDLASASSDIGETSKKGTDNAETPQGNTAVSEKNIVDNNKTINNLTIFKTLEDDFKNSIEYVEEFEYHKSTTVSSISDRFQTIRDIYSIDINSKKGFDNLNLALAALLPSAFDYGKRRPSEQKGWDNYIVRTFLQTGIVEIETILAELEDKINTDPSITEGNLEQTIREHLSVEPTTFRGRPVRKKFDTNFVAIGWTYADTLTVKPAEIEAAEETNIRVTSVTVKDLITAYQEIFPLIKQNQAAKYNDGEAKISTPGGEVATEETTVAETTAAETPVAEVTGVETSAAASANVSSSTSSITSAASSSAVATPSATPTSSTSSSSGY